MKILLIIFCSMSIRSTLGMSGLASPQRLHYSRRRLLLPNQIQRVNPDVAKLTFLKQLLELDSLRNIYIRNCQIGHQFSRRQKFPSTTRFNGMPAFRNNGIHSMTRSGVRRKYFINPKVIILPPMTSPVETMGDNFQNLKGLNVKEKLPQYLRGVEEEKKTKTADAKSEGSFQKGNHDRDFEPGLVEAKNSETKIWRLEENKTVSFGDAKVPRLSYHHNPLEPSTDTYPKTTPNLLSILTSSPTQIYEVEEIIEGTVNVDEDNFQKLKMGEKPQFENNIKSISNEQQEQKILDNSIMSIIKGMTEQVTNSPPSESILREVSPGTSSKAPFVQTTGSTQSQHFFRALPSNTTKFVTKKTIIPSKTTPTVKEYPSRGFTQHPDLSPIKKLDNEQGAPKLLNKIFEVTPSITTNHLKHGISDNEKAQKIETKKFGTVPQTFFGFFKKQSSENPGQKLEGIPEKINSNSFALPSIPSRSFKNISDGNLQHLLRNLKVQEDLNSEMSKKEPTSSTSQSFSQTVTISVQIDNATLIPFTPTLNTQTPSTSESDKNIPAEVKTTTLRIVQGRKGTSLTTSSIDGFNANSTMSNFKELSDGPLSIDLLSSTIKPELKKDQESNGKNSRKMHFNHDTQEETTFNQITDSSDGHPRRSDILINDYADDYKDNENHFPNPTYLDRIKPNGTTLSKDTLSNIKIDSYIPLIPEIVNDIREDQISPQDLSLLSGMFGKYWSSILAMANRTELDVLPLLTMKNEDDLINFMESHFSDESKTSTTEIDEIDTNGKISPKDTYDYGGAYEDLYDYVLGPELRENRKRYRHKRDDELEYQKLEANKEYFESLEEEQRNGKIEYMVEYAMYDESLEDENLSVLELIKPADLYVNIKNETFREEQN